MKKIFVLLTCWRFVLHWVFFRKAKNHEDMADDLARNISQFVLKKMWNAAKDNILHSLDSVSC